MERVALDVLGPLPVTKTGNRYIVVICDCFTKWTEAVAVPDQEAKTVATALMNNFVSRFGCPLQIHTDQGRNFESKLFSELCELMQTKKTRTSPQRPQSNGIVERFNRTLVNMLSMYCNKEQDECDQYLPQVLMAYRASPHPSTGFSPNMLVFGRENTMPLQATIGPPPAEESETGTESQAYVHQLRQKMQEYHEMCRQKLQKSAQYRKKYYDLNSKKTALTVGQAVWLYDPIRKRGVCSKLVPAWKGPFLIVKRLDDLTYLIKKTAKQEAKVYHIDRLREYKGQHHPKWILAEQERLCRSDL